MRYLGAGGAGLYRDDFAPNPLQRALNATWPLFRAFGVDVRVHWSILVVPLIPYGMLSVGHVPAVEAALWSLALTVALYASIWTHEMGHVVAGRRYGVKTRLVSLSPLGGLAHMQAPAPSPKAEIVIALAGPLTQLLWVVALGVPWVLCEVHARAWEDSTVWALLFEAFTVWQASLVVFNLLPWYPMDGGRVLRGFLARRIHPNLASLWTAYVGFAGALVLGTAGILSSFHFEGRLPGFGGWLLIAIAVFNFLACRQLVREARYADSIYDRAQEPWKATLPGDEWMQGGAAADDPASSSEEDRRERSAAEARRREEETRRRLQERIDELLDRINELGGVEKLPAAERRELAEASALLRGETADR